MTDEQLDAPSADDLLATMISDLAHTGELSMLYRMEIAEAITQVRAELADVRHAVRWAHDTLYELNPSNYDHDEVCKANDASVEVILGLAPMIGEMHGKSPDWWKNYTKITRDQALRDAANSVGLGETVSTIQRRILGLINKDAK